MNEFIALLHSKLIIAVIGSASAGIVSFIILDDAHIIEKRKTLKGKALFFYNIGVLLSEVLVSLFAGMFVGVPFAIKMGQDETGIVMFAIISSLLGRKLIASIKSGKAGNAIISTMIDKFKK